MNELLDEAMDRFRASIRSVKLSEYQAKITKKDLPNSAITHGGKY